MSQGADETIHMSGEFVGYCEKMQHDRKDLAECVLHTFALEGPETVLIENDESGNVRLVSGFPRAN